MTSQESEAADLRPLAGLRVFELSIAVAAPSAGRMLSYHGAEVVKVEARSYPDVARLFSSSWARDPELADVACDTSPYISEWTAGKRSLGLELKVPGATDVAKRLLANSDVFLTNFAAPAVKRLGFSYEDALEVNPKIIYAGLTGFGSDPELPYYAYRAFGPNQAPLAGLDALTGYADQAPAGVSSSAPPDYIGSVHAVLGILTAIHQRDQTGEGTFIDVSQMDTTVAFLGQHLIGQDFDLDVPQRNGNRLPWAAPCGVYPTTGDDSFVAITVDSDESWAGLASVAGLSTEGLATTEERIARHDELDQAIEAWTIRHSADEAAAALQAAGVAAHAVLDHAAVLRDAHIRDRGWFEVKPSTRLGKDLFSGHPVHLSETPPHVDRAGPSMGEDTIEVLLELGYSNDEIDALIEAGAAFTPARPEFTMKRPFADFYEVSGLGEGSR